MIRFFGFLLSNLSIGALFAVGGIAALVHIYGRDLPKHDELQDYQPRMLSRVYSGEGQVIAEFARERRVFVPIDEVPKLVKQAFISAEDKNFYEHPGVDAVGIGKAIARFGMSRAQGRNTRLTGASTITQQVMKNFLLTADREIERKIREMILAVRLDGALTKDQILELYLNEIYLGARSYGIVAAAENYFGKTLEELEPREAAYLAALPKAPSELHPIRQVERATIRRNYVLEEMAQNRVLAREIAEAQKKLPLETILAERRPTVLGTAEPNYFTEEVRRQLVEELGEDMLYEGGLTIRATIDPHLQNVAGRVLRSGLERYDRGQGTYRGPVAKLPEVAAGETGIWRELLMRLDAPRDVEEWQLAVVLELGDTTALVGVENLEDGDGTVRLTLKRESEWIKRTPLSSKAPRRPSDIWERGDVVFVKREDEGWSMRQIPDVQGAFMAMDPHSGRVLSIQGGFSYEQSVFNRATQALRQPGSSFKPFVYAAALDAGYTPATVVLDAPVVVRAGGQTWRPKNSSGKFYGPSPLRVGLELSRNLMTVRIAQAVGMDRVAVYAERFGIYDQMPDDSLSYALGAGETTLYKMVSAYGMIVNGGKRLVPTLVDRVQDRHGKTLYRHDPRICQGCDAAQFTQDRVPVLFDQRSQIMDPVTAYQLVTMLEGVVARGTARRTVGGLEFPVAGKTGTTNDAKDAWFIGFTENMVAGCFIGFDTPKPMGKSAYGGTLCGPVFREFMAEAMAQQAPGPFNAPLAGSVVTIKIDRETGERLPDDAEGPHVLVETFRTGTEPEILVDDAYALMDDAALFAGLGADLPYLLPEGEDLPLTDSLPENSDDPDAPQPPKPASVGLGTGGLY